MANDSQPSFKAPGRDRRDESHRRAARRDASKASDRGGTPRRAYVNRPAPLGSGALQGELVSSEGARCTIKVWDLGEGGVCVFTQREIESLTGDDINLTIFDRY